MSSDPHWDGYVEASVQMPRMGKLLRYRVSVADFIMRPFERLPRDRELDFMPESRREAHVQQTERRELAQRLSAQLTECILKAIESDDTINGYEPEEWARFHPSKSS